VNVVNVDLEPPITEAYTWHFTNKKCELLFADDTGRSLLDMLENYRDLWVPFGVLVDRFKDCSRDFATHDPYGLLPWFG